jgi:predicted  nucleic acid-binding Zn-ribbon protein
VAAIVALAAMQYYVVSNLRAVQSEIAFVAAEQAKTRNAIQEEVEKVRAASSETAAERQKAMAEVRGELEQAREQARDQARGIASKVREESLKTVQELNARVVASEQKQRESQAQVASELSGLRQEATAASTTLAAVTTEVREVREEVANTRGQLSATIADLKRVTGDLGVMSGLIATNGQQIEALKKLGDRVYSEFTVRKTKTPVRIGDVWVLLKNTDPGRSRFTIQLGADDRKIEKKDRTVNEPVQFYVGRNRRPHELVVNQVHKNQIVGYLAAPKESDPR